MYLGTKPKVKVTTGPVEDMDLGERKGKKLGLNPTEAFGPSYCCDLLRRKYGMGQITYVWNRDKNSVFDTLLEVPVKYQSGDVN